MRTEILQPTSPAWAAFLARRPHDFHYVPGYVALNADYEGARCETVLIEDGPHHLFVPYLIRPVPDHLDGGDGLFDAVTPYGYTGPLFDPDSPDAFVAEATAALGESLAERGIVSLFARLHPLYPPTDVFLDREDVVHLGDTVSVDLTGTPDEMMAATRKSHRYEIRQAIKSGRQDTVFDTEWERFDDFFRIYGETMQRLDASGFYCFPREYFQRLKEVLGSSVHLVHARVDGDVAASSLFTENSGIVQYHLSGMDERHRREQPTKLMMHNVRLWAAERGNRILHLGGGLGAGDDSLFRFKAGFSKSRHAFHVWRFVADEERYGELVARWKKSAGDVVDPDEGFFPAYRRSTAASS